MFDKFTLNSTYETIVLYSKIVMKIAFDVNKMNKIPGPKPQQDVIYSEA